ncbi:acid phosphatase 1 [Cavenderia fasciculata]|uniref:Acid phosphatase 1 n=1 Tax=Cavenderia fasciculata TaxID=261658 RepID=F4PJL7_CACFS|nr:acid phosphatase 1 [Cavenderia fasciculata]EGG23791.1 acid phosphatase 1 [Cavenderia fasciculata]|eukprot:XP_004361642.1 acid phosphatase 1 [Cavenderia fasciculata]
MEKKSVLFVCLGNICRSPMGEIVFRALAFQRGILDDFHIDSCGTSGYHIGDNPDGRSVETCSKLISSTISSEAHQHFKSLPLHKARQLSAKDFKDFDYIFAMDGDNLKNIQKLYNQTNKEGSGFKAKITRIGEYHSDKKKLNVEDPYYGKMDGFTENYNQILESSNRFLDSLGYDSK